MIKTSQHASEEIICFITLHALGVSLHIASGAFKGQTITMK